MKTIPEIAKDALELPTAQRLTLARILLDLSDEPQEFSLEVQAAWDQELLLRIEEVKAGRSRSSSVDEVFARLDQQFSK